MWCFFFQGWKKPQRRAGAGSGGGSGRRAANGFILRCCARMLLSWMHWQHLCPLKKIMQQTGHPNCINKRNHSTGCFTKKWCSQKFAFTACCSQSYKPWRNLICRKKVLHIIDSLAPVEQKHGCWFVLNIYISSRTECSVWFFSIRRQNRCMMMIKKKIWQCEIFMQNIRFKKFCFGCELKKILRGHGYCAIHNHTDFVSRLAFFQLPEVYQR